MPARPLPLYIFDLDGTLALTEHRQHILDGNSPAKWRDFFAACVDDEPNHPVIHTLRALIGRAEIWIWSGRSDEVRHQTEGWLDFHVMPNAPIPRMRAAGDFTPDEQLKKRWLDEMADDDRKRLVAVFDDRAKVVAMWRAAGVPCFQVAPGEF